ncbi:MAG: hypothetical protein ACRDQ1_08815 [Sciscionella sp.]
MNALTVAGRGRVVVHQAEDFLAGACAQFAAPEHAEPSRAMLEASQALLYYALGCWLESPTIVCPLCDGLLVLARARANHAAQLSALQRARTRLGQAAFYLPRHVAEPTPEIES